VRTTRSFLQSSFPLLKHDKPAAMEINPKVRNAAENGDLEQTVTGGPSQPGDVHVSDDVFGEVGEDGPNYRNVCLYPCLPDLVSTKG